MNTMQPISPRSRRSVLKDLAVAAAGAFAAPLILQSDVLLGSPARPATSSPSPPSEPAGAAAP